MKLTKEQSKMVIEYFAVKAAEEAPIADLDWKAWDRHIGLTWLQTSIAIERRINEHDWATLVNAALDSQSFDRDPAGYMNDRGEEDTAGNTIYWHEQLQDILSASIDTAFNTSKAA